MVDLIASVRREVFDAHANLNDLEALLVDQAPIAELARTLLALGTVNRHLEVLIDRLKLSAPAPDAPASEAPASIPEGAPQPA